MSRVLRFLVILISLLGVVSCGGTKTPSPTASAYMGPSPKAVSVVLAHGFTEDPSGCYGYAKSSCRSFEYQTLTTIFLVQGGELQVILDVRNLSTEWALAGPVLNELYPAPVVQAANDSLQNALNSGGKGVGGPNGAVAKYNVSASVWNKFSATVVIGPKTA
jgi:hypothetical protein